MDNPSNIEILERLRMGFDAAHKEIKTEFTAIRKDAEKHIKKHFMASLEIINKLTFAAELRDEETGNHIKRISLYSKILSMALGLDSDFIDRITYASKLHDIGKIGIPDAILLKKDKLTKEEFSLMKTHTTLGYEILKDSEFPLIEMAARIAYNHHERFDGEGYPRKLKGEYIPVESRIVTLCDQYDSLRAKRPYKKGMTHTEAIRILSFGDEKTQPSFIDPYIFKKFLSVQRKFEEVFETNK